MILTSEIIRKSTLTGEIVRKSLLTSDIVRKSLLTSVLGLNEPPCPEVVSVEIGLIDAYTIDVLFDKALWDSKIPDAADLIPAFSGGATQIYDRSISGAHLYAKTGVTDWYLPSKLEMRAIGINLYQQGIGGLFGTAYKTSSEYNATVNWTIDIRNPSGEFMQDKSGVHYNVACRTFTSSTVYALRDIGPAGGWVFNIIDNGDGTFTYLEMAPSVNTPSIWSNINLLVGTTGTAIGTGQANTTAIINQVGHTTSAAKLCDDLIIGRAITASETGTIQYIPNADDNKKLQGTNGAKVVAFTESVTNNVW